MTSPHSLLRKGKLWCFLLGLISFGPTCALLAAAQLNAASFDCSKANTAVEHMICGQEELSKLDGELGEAYVMAIKKAPDSRLLKEQQSEWLKTRQRCDDPACVQQLYVKRIGVLKRIISLVPLEKGQESYFFESEADKLRVIRDVVRQQKFVYSPRYAEAPEYCKAFMRDFVAGRNIEAIEPEFRTEDKNDPRFAELNRCKDYSFPEGVSPESFYGVGSLGDSPYRYYRLDLDDNPENGTEYLYYHEHGGLGETAYSWVDVSKCEVEGGVAIESRQTSGSEPRALYRQNMLVRYQKEMLALALFPYRWSIGPSRYGVDIARIRKSSRPRYCSWAPVEVDGN